MTTIKTQTIENTCFKPVFIAGSNPALSAMKKARESVLFFNDIRPWGTDDILDSMISASQMIYASRMEGTDIISYLRSKYIMRRSAVYHIA